MQVNGAQIGARYVRTVLKVGTLKSLNTPLLNCEVNNHRGDWRDRWKLNMWH